ITDSVKEELSSLVQSLAPELKENLRQIDLDAWSLQLSARAKESSGIADLIEFSRAVHAEMDALISLSRSGGGVSQNGTLYTTTFPCHNCARHIIAAGIKKVYYIEPYEKSLALASHSDAIDVVDFEDPSAPYDPQKTLKVQFIHFSGVAPRVFNELFSRDGGRKSQDGSFREFVDYESALPEKV
uniref:deaminase n=1 Tax=Chromobacterium sp. ASV23 TaxID=2795110 RepID=UPI001E5EABDB